MTDFSQFTKRCKMRYDFGDQIQVRYQHPNGEVFDTWVSGEEAMQRLRSEAAEKRLKGLSGLKWEELRKSAKELPAQGKEKALEEAFEWLIQHVEGSLGGNVIGNALADALRTQGDSNDSDYSEKQRWTNLLKISAFRVKILELAWIQLEGSFPDDQWNDEPDDWI